MRARVCLTMKAAVVSASAIAGSVKCHNRSRIRHPTRTTEKPLEDESAKR